MKKSFFSRKFLWILCAAVFMAALCLYFCRGTESPLAVSSPVEPVLAPTPEFAPEWLVTHILSSRPKKEPPLSSKIRGKLHQLSVDLSYAFEKKTEEPDFSNMIITESFAGGMPPANYGSNYSSLSVEDAAVIFKKYGNKPFLFTGNKKIDVEEMMQVLVREGYRPQKGVYDGPTTGTMLEGFSFPLKDEATGYAVCIEYGKIAQIRKLRNYDQYLEAMAKKAEYTGRGIFEFFIPELRNGVAAPGAENDRGVQSRAASLAMAKWSPEQITYTYVSKNWPTPVNTPDSHKVILQQSFKECYLEKATYSSNYISVGKEDRGKIIEAYGENPFRLRFNDEIEEASVFRKLEQAGYQPQILKENRGFSFPLKNGPEGYAVFVHNGRISQIRELRNYAQFLVGEKKEKINHGKHDRNPSRYQEYTSKGVLLFYLPDLTKKANP